MESTTEASTPMAAPTAPMAHVNETPESEASKRKRQPRNSACQHCAQLKMKCIQQPNGICERCNRMGRECVPAMPKPRKRRTLEADGIPLHHFPTTPGPPPRFDPPSAKQVQHQPDDNALLSRHDISHTDSRSFVSLFSRGLGNATVCEELLNGIDYSFVLSSFTRFRQFTPHFPFVEIAPGADVLAMVSRRPMLTLAVCTAASTSWPDIQHRLSEAFLYALATKAVLADERSLDLFTGLLVYLAWQHHYLSQQQTYQKLCLLAGMATDLGLYRSNASPTTDAGTALEQDRAFVGAYYLCCGLSAKSQDKPSPLRWTERLRRSAENAAHSGTLPTDRTLPGILELTHAMDDLEDNVRSCNVPSPAHHYVDLSARSSLHRLEMLKRDHPTLNGTLDFASATIRVHQHHLRHSDLKDSSKLIKCACAVKEFLDELLARPPATLHQMSVIGWASFLETLVVMTHVSRPSQTAGWEAGAVTSMLEPDAVLDSIYKHMASTPTNDPLIPRSDALCGRLYAAVQAVKGRIFAQEREPGGAGNGVATGHQNPMAKTSLDVLNSSRSGVLDPTFWDELTKGT